MSIEDIYPLAVEFRRYFHQYPEFAMQEFATQHYIMNVLDQYAVSYHCVGTGIVAILGTGEKCVAIRADMDALKVKEETGLSYSSCNEGMMHACGHDMHIAMLLGSVLVLKSREHELKGTIKIIFQPSEEKRPGGARLLLPELLKAPVPQAIFGQHVFPDLPTGTIGIRPGAFFASSDNIIFSVEGKGTHAAMPHLGSDPILATASLIQFYQTLITKFRDPLVPAVISITSVHGGTCNNVIPDRVDVLGTVRTHDNNLRRRIFELIEEKSKAICDLYGCTFTMDNTWNGLPVLVNDEQLTDFVVRNATEILGEKQVVLMNHLTLGEDFAIYTEKIPGAFWVLGVRPPEQESMPPLHNPKMSPDEQAIKTGIALMVENCVRVFHPNKSLQSHFQRLPG